MSAEINLNRISRLELQFESALKIYDSFPWRKVRQVTSGDETRYHGGRRVTFKEEETRYHGERRITFEEGNRYHGERRATFKVEETRYHGER